jgi:thioredoxin 1
MLDKMTILTADNFSSFTRGSDCLLLVFKNLCPHCKVLMTVIEKCLPTYPDLIVAGVNSEEYPTVLTDLDVSKVPTVLIYKNGVPAVRRSGVMNPAELSALISKAQTH